MEKNLSVQAACCAIIAKIIESDNPADLIKKINKRKKLIKKSNK
jgi:hypothetical protein